MPTSPTLHWLAAAAAALSLGAAGCAHRPPAAEMGFTHPVWTSDGLYLVDRTGPGALFLTPSAALLDGYRSVVIEEISLGFKAGIAELPAVQQKRARAMVQRNMVRMMSLQGLSQVDHPGPGTLRMRIAISQIDYPQNLWYGSSSTAVCAWGNVAITMELRDSVDDRRLLIYAQKRQFPARIYAGPGNIGAHRIADAFIEYTLDLWRTIGQAEQGRFAGPRTQASLSPLHR